MADDVDVANSLIENEIAYALRRFKQVPEAGVNGAAHCEECGDDIPAARRKLGFKFCVPCAQEQERKQSLFA